MKKFKVFMLSILSFVVVICVAPFGAKKDIHIDTTITKKVKTKPKKLLTKLKNKEEIVCKSYEPKQKTSISDKEVKHQWQAGYISDNVNVRANPDINSSILEIYEFNTPVYYEPYNEEWVRIKYNDTVAYISKPYVLQTPYQYIEYSMPDTSGFKSYMPYDAITNKTSAQYKLQYDYAYTGNYGIRQVNNRYCIAIGTAFGANIGDYVDLVLDNCEIIHAIVSDIKDDKDTDSHNIITMHNGCVSEFLIDDYYLDRNIRIMGDISSARPEWSSKVVAIRIYNKNVFN